MEKRIAKEARQMVMIERIIFSFIVYYNKNEVD
jgi:hypothetical protein